MTPTSVTFRAASVAGYATGALDIAVAGRRVISIPSQLGCHVSCRFCVSKDTPLIRNLTTDEMLQMVQACFDVEPPDGRAVELSFTVKEKGCTTGSTRLPVLKKRRADGRVSSPQSGIPAPVWA